MSDLHLFLMAHPNYPIGLNIRLYFPMETNILKNQVVLYSGAILFDIKSSFCHKLVLKDGGRLITRVVLYLGQYGIVTVSISNH